MFGDLVPEEWSGRYVALELGNNDPIRLTARLDRVAESGIVALVKVAVPSVESRGKWGAPSYLTRFAHRCYPWHSVHSVRLLEPEERAPLEEEGWPPEEDPTIR